MTEGTRDKLKIDQAIVVEGRDDEAVVRQVFDGLIIVTHGFGITAETWNLIEKAYREKGIIIFTDPDHSGEEIRKKITERCPGAIQANIPRGRAFRDGDIGVENASPEDVAEALSMARTPKKFSIDNGARKSKEVTREDLAAMGLDGVPGAAKRRAAAAAALGTGYGNAKTFLRKVNAFGITAEEIQEALADEQ